ncbi:hypothetical protein [Marinobacter similis]|uniref:Uncharacterized protein n=1 Tax=Marinobacter similis TaxID=1420916 RepID=W5YUW3_9GAMM|nr:hypothetical protein [Marinobacter similis]AHI30293.1 hypothetical protein AU14_17640 [Marinobacter similis]
MSTYNHENMMSCAIVWESILELRDERKEASPLSKWVVAKWEEIGTCEMREYAVSWAKVVDDLWRHNIWLHECNGPFDWDFVPDVLRYHYLLSGDLELNSKDDFDRAHMAGVLAALTLAGKDFEQYQGFDTRFVTLFKDNKDGYWDDADPTHENAIRSAMGVYGRTSDGLAEHILDLQFDEFMVNRLKHVMTTLKTWLVDNKPHTEGKAA